MAKPVAAAPRLRRCTKSATLHTDSLNAAHQNDTERKFTLPNRSHDFKPEERAFPRRKLLSFLEPGIFAHGTLLPTQSLTRRNTLNAMASALERWATDPAVRKSNSPSEVLTENEQMLIDGIVPQMYIRSEAKAVGKTTRKKMQEGCHGGYADGIVVRDFAIGTTDQAIVEVAEGVKLEGGEMEVET